MESNTWVFCDSPDGDYPVQFCGTEKEMEKAGKNLLRRYRASGFPHPLMVWTGYEWMKKGKPCCRIDEQGVHHLEATA